MSAEPLRLELELEVDANPIQGSLRDERGRTATFAGWLELIAILEKIHAGDPDNADRDAQSPPS